MTLVEVVGGLGLLGALLAALLMAKARYTRQAAAAEQRIEAVAAADALLTAWHQNPASLPRAGAGIVAGEGRLSWRTQVVSNPAVNELEADVVRLEILDTRAQVAGDRILASVEFVVEPHPENIAAAKNEKSKTDQGSRRKSRSSGANKPGAAPGAR